MPPNPQQSRPTAHIAYVTLGVCAILSLTFGVIAIVAICYRTDFKGELNTAHGDMTVRSTPTNE